MSAASRPYGDAGLINLDFADVRTVMSEMGKAMMERARLTASPGDRRKEAAISNPLLDDITMKVRAASRSTSRADRIWPCSKRMRPRTGLRGSRQ